METTTNTHQLFLHIAEYIDTLTSKGIADAEMYARITCKDDEVRRASLETRLLANLTVYKIDDHPHSKYIRVTATLDNGQVTAHSFIDRETGSVYKPAGWKSPAKGKNGKPSERYNLLNDESRAKLLERCEFTGGYLYADTANK
jgi:hypothetical protein